MGKYFKTKIDFGNSPNHKHSTAVLIVSFKTQPVKMKKSIYPDDSRCQIFNASWLTRLNYLD